MDGIHDMGGMEGFGPVPYRLGDESWHEGWEQRAMAVTLFARVAAHANLDQFRHAIERVPPGEYLTSGYFGRWIRAAATLLDESGVADDAAPPPKPTPGSLRPIDEPPRFDVGDRVLARDIHPTGHTRLPRYCRGRIGTVARVHPSFVFPDSNAHLQGEQPQFAYAVRFAATDLWGDEADDGVHVHVDLFDSYLEAIS